MHHVIVFLFFIHYFQNINSGINLYFILSFFVSKLTVPESLEESKRLQGQFFTSIDAHSKEITRILSTNEGNILHVHIHIRYYEAVLLLTYKLSLHLRQKDII